MSPRQHQQHGKAPCHQPQTLNKWAHTVGDVARKRLRNTRDNNGARRRIVVVVVKTMAAPTTNDTHKQQQRGSTPTTSICTPLTTTTTPAHERAAPTDDNAPPQMACAQPTNPAMQGHNQASVAAFLSRLFFVLLIQSAVFIQILRSYDFQIDTM
ncbi:hypothetical protein K443DRAFT_10636 [Laccaria amethystina LaAM-08-1]|uniref:Uncharacterized protein n=1 Tax=Laccaria amethystina LaAM-08-1 TaxID=1095629 RepID=A0A0C9WKK3_9AGAR|nr:hypothetical protein K443DRAFT_10636 [Laccaria amethystina LaAM-08-1]